VEPLIDELVQELEDVKITVYEPIGSMTENSSND
jgi:hypothetical protein